MRQKVRLRPILMTTAAMIAGFDSVTLPSGAGAVSRLVLSIVIVSGLAIGTLFTLFVLPEFILWWQANINRYRCLKKKKAGNSNFSLIVISGKL